MTSTVIRLHRAVLVSNLASGATWLLLLAPPWSDAGSEGLFPAGTAYVVVASCYLAAVHARERLTARQRAWSWVAPWLGAIGWWTFLGIIEDPGLASEWALTLALGVLVMTPSYLVWQAGAWALRAVAAKRPRTRSGS